MHGRTRADALKLQNRRTYQELIFAGLGLRFDGERYVLPAPAATDLSGDVAIAPVAGPVWPMKGWASLRPAQTPSRSDRLAGQRAAAPGDAARAHGRRRRPPVPRRRRQPADAPGARHGRPVSRCSTARARGRFTTTASRARSSPPSWTSSSISAGTIVRRPPPFLSRTSTPPSSSALTRRKPRRSWSNPRGSEWNPAATAMFRRRESVSMPESHVPYPPGARRVSRREDAAADPAVQVALLTGGSDKPYALGIASALCTRDLRLDFIGSDQLDCPEVHRLAWTDVSESAWRSARGRSGCAGRWSESSRTTRGWCGTPQSRSRDRCTFCGTTSSSSSIARC